MAIDSATSLLFSIGANTDDAEANISRFRGLFSTSLSDLSTQFDNFAAELTGGGEQINASFTAIASIAAGATVAVGAGLFEMARKTAETGEQLLLLSQQVGLSVEELSGLKVVAEQMGVDFDTLSRGVAIMDRSLSPFASSGATAAKALASIGVTATNTSGQLRPNAQILADVADKFAAMQDGANKTALAMSIFGRSGMEMIPILDKGGAAIRSAADEATKLGLVWTQDGAEHSAKFEEATRNLTMTFEGLVQKIGMAVIPAFTDGLKDATDVATASVGFLSDHGETLVKVIEAAAAAAAAYALKLALATAAQLDFNLAAAGGAVLSTLGAAFNYVTTAVAASTVAIKAWSVAEGVATLGLTAIAYEAYTLIDRVRELHILKRETAADDQVAAARDREAVANQARIVVEVEKVTGAKVAGANASEKYAAAQAVITRMSSRQLTAFNALEAAYIKARGHHQASGTAAKAEVYSLSSLASAYQSVTAAIQSMQDAESKPEAAAEAQYQRGLAAAQKQLDLYRKQIAAGKQTDETLGQYEVEYQQLKTALAQKYLLTIQQIWAQEDKAAAAREQARAKALQTASTAATAAATKMWQAEGAAALAAMDSSDKAMLKQIETAQALQASVDTTTQKLTAMGTKSADAALSAGAKIRAEYQHQIDAIHQLIAAEQKKGITEQQESQLTRAAAAAQHAASDQEVADLAKLRQQQAQTTATSLNSFIQMGVAAAGYRSAVVTALMDVIKTLEQEMIAHMASAAGAAAAENLKNVAVGKGVGLRSVWHAAEQFALAIADVASLNFSGAAAHFAAAGAFTSVAASVGTAVAGLFAGGGSSSASAASSAAATSTTAAATTTAAGTATPAPTVNIHIDGVISADNLAGVLAQANKLIKGGQSTLTATHIMIAGAARATG